MSGGCRVATALSAAECVPMVLRCPACDLRHLDVDTNDWWRHAAVEHFCVGCGRRWRPLALTATFGLDCTGWSASWCPIHGDCDCPGREQGIADPSCPLHGERSEHDREKVCVDELRRMLEGRVERALPDGTPWIGWAKMIDIAEREALLMPDEVAFLRRVHEPRRRA